MSKLYFSFINWNGSKLGTYTPHLCRSMHKLFIFTSEIIKIALEVGTQKILGGQAHVIVEGVQETLD
jgi:hypothetical protein